jgi:hypothetical protein
MQHASIFTMSQELNEQSWNRGYREYFWFAMTLVALIVCTVISDTDRLAGTSFATSQATVSR